MNARRITVYKVRRGGWKYKVQGGNWQVIDRSEEPFKEARYARKRAMARWPGVELVVER